VINALDPDSDGDGVLDGTEAGVTTGVPGGPGFRGTDTSSRNFRPDADPRTRTNPLKRDTDGDGKTDGEEDLDRNGRVDVGETDPLDDGDRGKSPPGSKAKGGGGGGGCAAGGAGNPLAMAPLAALALALAAGRRFRVERRRPRSGPPAFATRVGEASGLAHGLSSGTICALLSIFCSGPAFAAGEGFSARRFHWSADGLGIHNLPSPEVLLPLSVHAGMMYDHAWNPVEVGSNDGDERVAPLVDDMDTLNFVAAIGLPEAFEVGLSVPAIVARSGSEFGDPDDEVSGGGLGDLRASLKWRPLVSGDRDSAGGLEIFASFPTGDEDELRGEGLFSLGFRALVEQRFERLRLLGALGFEWLDGDAKFAGVRVDDRVLLGAGAAFMVFRDKRWRKARRDGDGARSPFAPNEPSPPQDAWRLDLEASIEGSFRLSHPSEESTLPFEVYGGLRLDTPIDLSVVAGGAAGLTGGVAAPEARLFVGVGYTFGGSPRTDWKFAR
jgi:MYXO-CTERM domain-containing protein